MKLQCSVSGVLSLGLLLSASSFAVGVENKEPEPARTVASRSEEPMHVAPRKKVKELKTEKELKEGLNSGEHVVVNVHASWCGACKMVEKPLEDAARLYREMKVFTIDADNPEFKEFLKWFKVTGLPTFLMFRKETGSRTGDEFNEMFGQLTGAPKHAAPVAAHPMMMPHPSEHMMMQEPAARAERRSRREERRARRKAASMAEMGFPMGDEDMMR